jgi:SAM-dependent methyltransferase
MLNDYHITESRKKLKNIILNYLFSNSSFFPKKIKILEVGSGFGFTLKYIITNIKKKIREKNDDAGEIIGKFKKTQLLNNQKSKKKFNNINFYSIDFSKKLILHQKSYLKSFVNPKHISQSNVLNIKYKKLFFDLTFTHGLLCCFKSEKKLVSALKRILRITKVLILCEPDYSEPMGFLEYLKFKKERNYKRFDYQNIFLINKIKCERIFYLKENYMRIFVIKNSYND